MTFSASTHPTGGTDLRLAVRGRVLGSAAADLKALIIGAIVTKLPDTLLINLRQVTALSITGVRALLAGYITAIDNGTSYRVLHAHGQAREVRQATGALEMLADSDDLGQRHRPGGDRGVRQYRQANEVPAQRGVFQREPPTQQGVSAGVLRVRHWGSLTNRDLVPGCATAQALPC